MPRGKAHSDDVRAQVMAALLSGQAMSFVAEAFAIPIQTVSRWARSEGLGGRENKNDIGDLIRAYLDENLETLRAQAEFARDPDWLRGQPASEFAVLHGVLADKAIRILEAAERANAVNTPDAPEDAALA